MSVRNIAEFRDAALPHMDALYRYAISLTHDPSEAEDLVQEAFLRGVRAFQQLRPDSNLKSWLFTILRNIRLNQLRQDRSRPRRVDDIGEEPGDLSTLRDESAKDPYASYIATVQQADVRRAVDSLSPAYREVIVLREFEDLSYEEIAQVLECPTGTVMSRLARARDKLRILLQDWGSSAKSASVNSAGST